MNKQIEQLFKRHYRKMYLLAKVLLRDGDAAKDAVSDVFAYMLEIMPLWTRRLPRAFCLYASETSA